ncbi:MAG: hypothetical protein U0570_04075 [Phycisphaerales bacterium]
MTGLLVLVEQVLVNEDQVAESDFGTGFFFEFAVEGFGGGFAGFDVAAGEVPVVGVAIAAEEDVSVANRDAAGQGLDFFG